jgi:PAS domain S-box-containing protein
MARRGVSFRSNDRMSEQHDPPDASLRELHESEERFRLLVESVRDYAILMLDPAGRVISWNPGAERLKGYAASEIVGQHFSVFYPEEARRKNHPAEELRLAVERGRYEEEAFRVAKDGRMFWANVVITPIRDAAGRLVGFAKVTRDLTERRKLEEERERVLARLERSNRDLQEFAMIASHDLQEPLRKIRMFGERIRVDFASELPETARDYLSRMERAAERGQSLIQGLLAYSRLATRTIPKMPVSLAKIAEDVVHDLEARIRSVHGRVVLGALPTIEADPHQMRQLFENLIVNALKFHRERVPPVVEVTAEESTPPDERGPRRWRIRTSDNGIGFDEKHAERIFKLFQRLHERGAYEGSGMGLAICRKIVDRHGGSIIARSTPGAGSTFFVELPEQQPKGKEIS